MHVVVSKKDLLRVLTRCQNVADKKSTMPVLGNVLLETEGKDRLRLAATDLYLAVSGQIGAQVEQGGSIGLGAKDLLERVRNMPEGQVSLHSSDGKTTLRAVGASRRYTLQGIPGDQFPSLPQMEASAPVLELHVDSVSQLINATSFSISTDDTRAQLNSALLEWEGDRLRMVTTDGHRLSKMEQLLAEPAGTASMLIPLKGVLELKRLCDEARGEAAEARLRVSQSGPNAFFQLAGFTFSVKLVDAVFPPYQQVIPERSERSVRAPRLQLQDAVKAVSVAASERTGGIKLSVAPGKLRIESENPDSGEGFDELDVDYDGPELMIGFNAHYVRDVLGSITDEEVLLGVSGELDPAVLRPGTEDQGTSYLAVIMPMRI